MLATLKSKLYQNPHSGTKYLLPIQCGRRCKILFELVFLICGIRLQLIYIKRSLQYQYKGLAVYQCLVDLGPVLFIHYHDV